MKQIHSLLKMMAVGAVSSSAMAFAGVPLRFCVGPEGSTYHKAYKLMEAELLNAGFDVEPFETSGPLSTLQFLDKDHCDVGFTRADSMYFSATLSSTAMVISNNTLINLDDGTSDRERNPKKNVMSNEIFREYAQLVCNRALPADDIKDLKALAQKQMQDNDDLLRKINKLQNEEISLQASLRKDPTSQSLKTKVADVRMKIASLTASVAEVEKKTVKILFLEESNRDANQTSMNDPTEAHELWRNLIAQDGAYARIPTEVINANQPMFEGFDRKQIMMQSVFNNPNGCYLSIDRVGKGTYLSDRIDSEVRFSKHVKLIELNDWDFNDMSVLGLKVYEFVDLSGSKALANLRSTRPAGVWGTGFFKGTSSVETLTVKSMLVAKPSWYRQVQKNPFLVRAVSAAILKVKHSPDFTDPVLKN